ncbi:hypothetical protein EMCRGX_G007160 [Ephydatia muelleri]|eukprot:Em0002g1279a
MGAKSGVAAFQAIRRQKWFLGQDPNAPPSYQPHMEYARAANQPLHYNSLPPVVTYGPPVVASSPATVPANDPAFIDSDYNWTMSCMMILFCFLFGGWLSIPMSFMAVRISSSAQEAARRGDAALAQRKAMYSLLLNVIAIILYVYVAMTLLSFRFG